MSTPPPTDQELLDRFAPYFAAIAEGAAAREASGELPLAEVEALRLAGFGAVRLPREWGGSGASLRQLFLLLRTLGAADSNIPQALRQHIYWVELLLHRPDAPGNAAWVRHVAAGELFGNGTTEPLGSALGHIGTVLSRHEDGRLRLNGRKIYGTGNSYAQWVPVAAVDERGIPVSPIVAVDRAGVTITNDWNGFGQRTTATGSSVFDDVVIDDDEVFAWDTEGASRAAAGLHQAVLFSALAGVLEAGARDITAILRAKRRVFFTGTGELPKDDAVVQEHVGRARAAADTAALLVDGIARALEDAWVLWNDPAVPAARADEAFVAVELIVGSVQVTLSELALDTTAHLLDVLGASSLDRGLALDRHWRNARALASHNPYPFRARVLGDHELNGTPPAAFAVARDVGDKVEAAPAS
ncbi:acyl-CoA dehydrogenase family protein [Galbitalea soli]|uniref:Acyl-CoA dehydrogenase n=1 Tax=Galbitalea soli TaxID=1268042 RepID=A0A7C9PQD7_9MICO|nr:acyl-CoA dehydrogenase family protein [Galbitalea soli]NEM92548.1 acyl-CoA dehydrogenase [Galbitalea soli]NYJ29585.1 alkylation response protein AidB-like acyl-CoA dehydrogenase [Galbitalea soli]